MSTHAIITVEDERGILVSLYRHSDGYPDVAGAALARDLTAELGEPDEVGTWRPADLTLLAGHLTYRLIDEFRIRPMAASEAEHLGLAEEHAAAQRVEMYDHVPALKAGDYRLVKAPLEDTISAYVVLPDSDWGQEFEYRVRIRDVAHPIDGDVRRRTVCEYRPIPYPAPGYERAPGAWEPLPEDCFDRTGELA